LLLKNKNMPQALTLYRKKDVEGKQQGTKLFSCCVNTYGKPDKCSTCIQCHAAISSGKRCKRTTCLDSEYCAVHLKKSFHVVISKSRIPNAGMGLFCWTSKNIAHQERKKGATPIFKEGAFIVNYGGHRLRRSMLNKLYDYKIGKVVVEPTAPYAIKTPDENIVIDTICKRQAGAFANDSKGTGYDSNAKIQDDGKLYATKNIYKGDEIYVHYGDDYWDGYKHIDMTTKKVRGNSSVPQDGSRGRYVKNDKYVKI